MLSSVMEVEYLSGGETKRTNLMTAQDTVRPCGRILSRPTGALGLQATYP